MEKDKITEITNKNYDKDIEKIILLMDKSIEYREKIFKHIFDGVTKDMHKDWTADTQEEKFKFMKKQFPKGSEAWQDIKMIMFLLRTFKHDFRTITKQLRLYKKAKENGDFNEIHKLMRLKDE